MYVSILAMSLGGRIALIVGCVLGIALLAVTLVLVLRRRKTRAEAQAEALEAAPPLKTPELTPEEQKRLALRRHKLKTLFGTELRRLRAHTSGRDHRYKVPWCMVLGSSGAGQTTILASTGLHSPFSSEDDETAREAGCKWWFFDKGIALDIDGITTADEETFQTLLGLLRKDRPKKPLDSVVLVLSAAELYGEHKLSEEEARRRAELFSYRLQQLQRDLRIRVPVYMLVSKCDTLPGFVAYCGALAPAHRDQIFGWSSPHEPETPYASEWIDDAFDSVYRTQVLTQIEYLAEGRSSVHERDAAFLFPRHLHELKEPVRLFLDQIFKASVYSEPTLFRGLYFAGDASLEGMSRQAAADGAAAGVPRHPSFLNHLFAKKIFPEYGLARPLSRSLATLLRLLSLAKWGIAAFILIGVLNLWFAYLGLEQDTQTTAEFLDQILMEVGQGEGAVSQPDKQRFEKKTRTLLGAMANVSASRLRRFRIPSSWFSSIDDDVREMMKDAFETVVLSGLRYGLEFKAKQALNIDLDESAQVLAQGMPAKKPDARADPGPGDARPRDLSTIPAVQALDSMPEYQELQALSRAYAEFSQFVEEYNQLGNEKRMRMENVGPLVKYVFDIDLAEGFTRNIHFYEEALANANYRHFEMRAVSPKARDRAKNIVRALGRRVFLENPIDLELEEISRPLTRLKSEAEWGGADAGSDVRTLENLRAGIQRAQQDLERPEMAWLAKEQLDLGAPYQDFLNAVNRFSVGVSLKDEVQNDWREAFKRLRRKLLAYQAPSIGPFLTRDNEKGKLVLSANLVGMRNSLDGFFAQNYVQMATEKVTAVNPEGSYRVSWNEDMLRQAIQLSDSYTTFTRDRAGQFHELIRERVKKAAVVKLGQSMHYLLWQARRIEYISKTTGDVNALQDELTAEVADLRRVSPLLRNILDIYDRLDLKDARAELFRQLQEETRELLRRLDYLVDRDENYKVSTGKLKEWRGLRPPALYAFDVDDAEGLSQYLKAQRARMKFWARDFAKTPVSLLEGMAPGGGSSGEGDPVFVKWQQIVSALDGFEKMAPENSVKNLESFIEVTLMGLTPDNCLDLPSRGKESTDYFAQIQTKIYNAVRRRCVEFSEERLLEGYDRLAGRFRRDLADHFPFCRGSACNDQEDADPRDIKAFLQEFDDYFQKFDAYAKRHEVNLHPAMIASKGDISRFLDSVRVVRPFFAPLLSAKSEETLPRYNLSVQYRVNKRNEDNASQIVEWGLFLGDQRIDEPQTVWQLGDKIRLAFRWAKDGPFRPAQTGQVIGAQGDKEDTLSFEWGGRFALLRFLRNYKSQESDLRQSLDRQPHILKFVMRFEDRKRNGRLRVLPESYYSQKGIQSGQSKPSLLSNKVVIFVRFSISLPDSKEPIVLLSDWPASAPPLREWKQGDGQRGGL